MMFVRVSILFHTAVSVLEFENATSGSADLCALNNTEPEEGRVRLYGNNPGKLAIFTNMHVHVHVASFSSLI